MFFFRSHVKQTLPSFPYVIVRAYCTLCSRTGQYRLARLADKYGAEASLEEVLDMLAGDCKYRGRSRHPIRSGCGALFKDLAAGPDRPPPDVPPAQRLRLVSSRK